jgi:hypothetical protein
MLLVNKMDKIKYTNEDVLSSNGNKVAAAQFYFN